MEAAAGEKAHTEGTGLPLHRGSQEASMRGSKSWRVASVPSLCFPCFGLFYREPMKAIEAVMATEGSA
jgi:hypothetical protein